jgi:hypothetical protein
VFFRVVRTIVVVVGPIQKPKRERTQDRRLSIGSAATRRQPQSVFRRAIFERASAAPGPTAVLVPRIIPLTTPAAPGCFAPTRACRDSYGTLFTRRRVPGCIFNLAICAGVSRRSVKSSFRSGFTFARTTSSASSRGTAAIQYSGMPSPIAATTHTVSA